MGNPFANAIAKTAAAEPMGSVPITPDRILLVDGDGLAYYCAGNDDTDIGTARFNLAAKIQAAANLVGAERTIVLLTLSGSNKGHRYAIARVKPYQGQRANSKRPKNWQGLRDYMEGKEFPFEVDSTIVAEADDLFGWYSSTYSDVVILTQDKDMRMVPGLHLDWVTNRQHQVVAGEDSVFNDKQYGIKWFWLQMLHGDTADNIPGLPKYVVDGKAKPVGEVTAGKILAHSVQEKHFSDSVAYCYQSYYGERWLVEMLEQACLLWMRRKPEAWDDCLAVGGPMHCFIQDAEFESAYAEIEQRVKEADAINNAAQAERD